MTTSNRREVTTEQLLMKEFIKELEATAEQVQQLLDDIHNSKIDFAEIKTELRFLVENVKELSKIIRDGNGAGSILTRLALLEISVGEIKHYVEKDAQSDIEIVTRVALIEQRLDALIVRGSESAKKKETEDTTDKAGRWKLYATVATGVFTLIGTLIALFMDAC
jgi:predicted RNA-binding protein with EMAP domain